MSQYSRSLSRHQIRVLSCCRGSTRCANVIIPVARPLFRKKSGYGALLNSNWHLHYSRHNRMSTRRSHSQVSFDRECLRQALRDESPRPAAKVRDDAPVPAAHLDASNAHLLSAPQYHDRRAADIARQGHYKGCQIVGGLGEERIRMAEEGRGLWQPGLEKDTI